MESLLSGGINIFYNGLDLKRGTYNLLHIIRNNRADGMEEIKKIKQCIYEGYKLNMATWDKKVRSYVLDFKKASCMIDSPLITPFPFEDESSVRDSPSRMLIDTSSIGISYWTASCNSFPSPAFDIVLTENSSLRCAVIVGC